MDHTLGEYLTATFVRPSPSGKTDIWAIRSVSSSEVLGEIKWFGRWRQYVFFPVDGTIWNPDCLDAVSTFVRGRTKASAEARVLRKVAV